MAPPAPFNYDVKELFRLTAEAVVKTQQQLDGRLNLDYLAGCELDGQRLIFSIPRTSVRLRFGVIETAGGGWTLVPWKRNPKREQMHTHELEFFLDAVPEPPVAPVGSGVADAAIPLEMSAPYFILDPAAEKEVADSLLTALNPLNPSWVSAVRDPNSPGGVKDLTKLIGRDGSIEDGVPDNDKATGEIRAIRLTLKENKSEKGMVFFRVQGTPVSYLIVRVVGSDANDSIFLLTPAAATQVVIFSLDGDEVKRVVYQPLHRLLHTIRLSQDGALPPVITSRPAPDGVTIASANPGLKSLFPFARDIGAGYATGLKYVSRPETESVMEVGDARLTARLTPGIFYDFTSAHALLSYSLGYTMANGQPAATFDFGVRRTSDTNDAIKSDDDPDETKLIESRATIRVSRAAIGAQVKIQLETPEFVLSGAARSRLLALADNSKDEIEKAFKADGKLYLEFVKNQTFRRRVVAMLSYRGSPPKENFLVVWPGEHLSASRDFAFTCGLNKQRSRLDNIKPVMRVEDDIANIEFSTDAEASEEQYRAFHNFFHAVRIWRTRMMAA